MDPAVAAEPSSPKRPLEEENNVDLAAKRRRWESDLNRVAEIVLVLSAMARMRGERKPTDAEVALMAEAREKLVEMCGNVAPKDIVDKDAVGRVIEDLGLNSSVKDQRLGFCGPKLTISEKMAMSKRKMEESKKFIARSGGYTSQPSHAAAENHGAPLPTRTILSDKPGSAPHPSGALSVSATGRVPAAVSTSAANHMPTSEVKTSTAASGYPSNHLVRESPSPALPRAERAQGGMNGPSYPSQVQASSALTHLPVNAPTWSVHPQSALSAKCRPDNKAAHANAMKVDATNNISVYNMSAQATRDQTCRPFITQSVPGSLPNVHQPLPGMNFVQAPATYNHHSEIAKSIQKLLQQNLPDKPSWMPPSREYMSKAFPCQICKLSVNELDTVLICDACEKGYHLKCIHSMNLNGIPKGEWHCMKCLSLSNGKPLPPKYGRVMRNTSAAKVPSSSGAVQSSAEKKLAAAEVKVNQQKLTANESPGLQGSAQIGGGGRNNFESSSSARETRANNLASIRKDDQKGLSETFSNSSAESHVRSIQQSQNLAFSTHEGANSDSVTPCNAVFAASSNPQEVKPKPPCNTVSAALSDQRDIKDPAVKAELC